MRESRNFSVAKYEENRQLAQDQAKFSSALLFNCTALRFSLTIPRFPAKIVLREALRDHVQNSHYGCARRRHRAGNHGGDAAHPGRNPARIWKSKPSTSAKRSTCAAISSGIEPSSWDSLRRTKVFLKAPITTPQGGGFKSLNVTVRKTLGLYANVRPCVSYHPFVETKHPGMDVVIVRENEEDLYAGIEYQQTDQVMQCLKLISRPGSEKIVRYAFEYARRNNRKKVTCFTKDNIMKMTDGLFHKVFDEIAPAVSRHRERTLDRGHRRGQAGRHAGLLST